MTAHFIARLGEQLHKEESALAPIQRWIEMKAGTHLADIILREHAEEANDLMLISTSIGSLRELSELEYPKIVEAVSRLELRTPLLVGFFLGGLVIHGGLQGWWIAPVLASLSALPLFLGAAALTAFNDNALITYLATLVPNLQEALKMAVVEGAVAGGGLTVIANAPNPAGQALLKRFFDGSVSPLGLLAGAALPTVVAALAFRLL